MTADTPSIVMQHLLTASAQAAALAVLIGVLLLVFRGQVAPRWRHRLWWLVVLRLAIPVLPASPVSLYQWLPKSVAWQQASTHAAEQSSTPNPESEASHDNATTLPILPGNVKNPNLPTPSADFSGQAIVPTDPLAPAREPRPASIETIRPGITEALPMPSQETRSAAADTPAPKDTTWRWAWTSALIAWLCVSLLLILRTILGWLALRRRVRRDAATTSQRAHRLLQEEARMQGIKRPPVLLESPAVPGPTLLGVLRPTLLMPPELSESLDGRALRLVFRHELCHLRGRDNLANWLLAMLLAVHWFNPLAWWAFAQLRTQRELTRDAQTVRGHGAAEQDNLRTDNTQHYADALLAVVRFTVEASSPAPRTSVVTSAAVHDRKHLARRLAMLEHASRFRSRHTLLAFALLIVLAATGLTVAQGQKEDAQATIAGEPTAEIDQPANPADALLEHNGADDPGDDEATRAMRQIGTVAWEDVPFETVLADLEQLIDLEITLDPVIRDAIDGLDPKPNISLSLARVPMEQALKLAMEQLFSDRMGEALPPVAWKWTLDEGVLNLGLETVEIRVYDIRDLIAPTPPALTEAPWTDEEEVAARQEYTEQLRTLIQNTTGEPEHWSEQYAETVYGGTIRELNSNFIIQTTPARHREILGLLSRLRAVRGIQVSFEMRYLLLDSETFTQVFSQDITIPHWRPDSFQTIHPDRLGNHVFNGVPDETRVDGQTIFHDTLHGVIGLTLISEEQQAALLETIAQHGGIDMQLAQDIPRITAFNGQQAFGMTAQHLSYISALTPIPGSDRFDPALSVTQAGMLVKVMGTASADRLFVTAEIDFEAAAAVGPTLCLPKPGTPGNAEGDWFTEVPQFDHAAMHATLSTPVDKWLILVGPLLQGGGLPIMEEGADDPAQYTDTRRVVLLIKPTIIELAQQEIEAEDAGVPVE